MHTYFHNLTAARIFYWSFLCLLCAVSAVLSMPGMPSGMMTGMGRPTSSQPSSSVPEATQLVVRLDNGMEVALVPNHSAPLVACNLIVKAGAREETWNTWGAAHLLEHMLFNGTENRSQEEIYAAFDRMGAYDNAHTGNQYTDFMLVVSRDNFLPGFEILLDMVFRSILPPAKFEKERGIVAEEIAMNRSRGDDPDEAFNEVLFGQSSYGRDILGAVEAIERISRDSVLAYYRNWYVPNNAFLFVSGDFQPDTLLKRLSALITPIPPRELPPRVKLSPPDFRRLATAGLIERRTRTNQPRLKLAMSAPLPKDMDFPAFFLISQLLNRRLERSLPDGVAGWTNITFDPDFSVFELTLNGYADHPLALWEEALADFAVSPPSPDELKRVITGYRAERLLTSEQLQYYGVLNAPYWSMLSWDEFQSLPERMETTTSSDLMEVFQRWIVNQPALRMLILPAGESSEEALDATAAVEGRTLTKSEPDKPPEIIVRSDPSAKVFALHLLLKDRWKWEERFGIGTVDLLHRLIWETRASEGLTVSDRLDQIGAALKTVDSPGIPYDDYYTTPEYSFMRLESPADKWQEASELLMELISATPLDAASQSNAIQAQDAARRGWTRNPLRPARKMLRDELIPGSPLTKDIYGEDLGALDPKLLTDRLDTLKQGYFSPSNWLITASSPVEGAVLIEWLKSVVESRFADSGSPLPPETTPAFKPAAKKGFDRSLPLGRPQGGVLMGKIVEDVDRSQEAALMIANSWLNDYLDMNLREGKGLAYSLGSSYILSPVDDLTGWAFWEISISTRPENNSAARKGLNEGLNELAKHKFKPEEIERLVNAASGRLLMRDMSRISQAFAMGTGEFFRGDPDYRRKLIESLKNLTSEQVQSAARRYMRVGDFGVIEIE